MLEFEQHVEFPGQALLHEPARDLFLVDYLRRAQQRLVVFDTDPAQPNLGKSARADLGQQVNVLSFREHRVGHREPVADPRTIAA